MHTVYIVVCVAVGLISGCSQRNHYTELTMVVGPNWQLLVLPDGSGYYGFGAIDFNRFPAGTIDFDELVQRLLGARNGERVGVQFALAKAGRTRAHSCSSADVGAAREAFEKARRAAPLTDRMAEQWKQYPPFREP